MNRSELVEALNALPDIEVGSTDGSVTEVSMSSYDDESGTHDYIHLEISDEF
jgi:hypothetical protein